MKITSSAIFYMLQKQVEIQIIGEHTNNITIKAPRFIRDREVESGYLYIITEEMDMKKLDLEKEGAYLFCNVGEDRIPPSFSRFDCALYKGEYNALDLLDMINEVIFQLQEWDCALRDSVSDHKTLQDILEIGKELFEQPILVVDKDFKVDAYIGGDFSGSGLFSPDGHIQDFAVRELIEDEEFRNAARLKSVFVYPTYTYKLKDLCYNIFTSNRFISRVMILCEPYMEPDEGLKYLFSIFAKCVSDTYLYYLEDTQSFRQSAGLHNVVKEMLFGDNTEDNAKQLPAALEEYGWGINDCYVALDVQFTDITKFKMLSLYYCQQFESIWSQSIAILGHNRIVVVLNLTKGNDRINTSLFRTLFGITDDFVCKVGVSTEFNSFDEIKAYFMQAKMAVEIGQKIHSDYGYFMFENYVMDYVITSLKKDFLPKQLCHKGILKLMEYDREKDTDYIKTLQYYVRYKFNVSLAAEKMFVHRTTFIRRLERIQEIAKIDLDNVEEIIYIMMSMKLMSLLDENN